MGGGVSRPPGARQMVLYSLSRKTHFEKGELSKLHVKFRELAAKEGNPYTITLADFQEALTFVGIDESDGTLLAAVFKQMDLTDSGVETGQVNFSQFCAVCSSMLSGPMEEKLDFSFALYDTNGTGLVEKTGMECTELVDTIFKEHDTDGTGSLSYKQYMSAIVANPILTSFVSGQGKGPVSQASIKDLPADLPEAAPEADGPAPAPEEAAAYAAAPAPAA
ncbi:protein serine/threonine phosphatase [Aureococcus anophagefferens]|nr:protein serine/threonine phosphatase [Aureococcus anophagefferens]